MHLCYKSKASKQLLVLGQTDLVGCNISALIFDIVLQMYVICLLPISHCLIYILLPLICVITIDQDRSVIPS
jgi:hypothetical protein